MENGLNNWLISAGLLSCILGLIHSVLGEYLIFHTKREKGDLIPKKIDAGLKTRQLGIIWATWHIVSVFGMAIGIILIRMGMMENSLNHRTFLLQLSPLGWSMFVSAFLVLAATKGKHPGWMVLLIIGILIHLGI